MTKEHGVHDGAQLSNPNDVVKKYLLLVKKQLY